MAKTIIERIVNATRKAFIWTTVKTSKPYLPQNSLPQIRYARSVSTFYSHNQLIHHTREKVDADEVMLNTVLAVKAGEAVPIDGENCEVDEKTLTGESFPVANKWIP